jgi:hypothetical protein
MQLRTYYTLIFRKVKEILSKLIKAVIMARSYRATLKHDPQQGHTYRSSLKTGFSNFLTGMETSLPQFGQLAKNSLSPKGQ